LGRETLKSGTDKSLVVDANGCQRLRLSGTSDETTYENRYTTAALARRTVPNF